MPVQFWKLVSQLAAAYLSPSESSSCSPASLAQAIWSCHRLSSNCRVHFTSIKTPGHHALADVKSQAHNAVSFCANRPPYLLFARAVAFFWNSGDFAFGCPIKIAT